MRPLMPALQDALLWMSLWMSPFASSSSESKMADSSSSAWQSELTSVQAWSSGTRRTIQGKLCHRTRAARTQFWCCTGAFFLKCPIHREGEQPHVSPGARSSPAAWKTPKIQTTSWDQPIYFIPPLINLLFHVSSEDRQKLRGSDVKDRRVFVEARPPTHRGPPSSASFWVSGLIHFWVPCAYRAV
jgi:hypothetical protein